jgi:hypothetical protein
MMIDLLKKSIPEYKLFLPDLNNTFSYRPLLVKEEKFLSIITTINSSFDEKLNNLCMLVDSCFNNKIESKKLTINDFQLALNSIRQKSISEVSEFKITCPYTKELVNIKLNLNTFTQNKTDKLLKILINEQFIFVIEKPKVSSLFLLDDFPSSDEDWFRILCDCLVEVVTEKEKISLQQSSIEEKISYIELIDKNSFKEIKKFVKSNTISFKINYISSDEKDRTIEVNDFVNFFKFFLVMLI